MRTRRSAIATTSCSIPARRDGPHAGEDVSADPRPILSPARGGPSADRTGAVDDLDDDPDQQQRAADEAEDDPGGGHPGTGLRAPRALDLVAGHESEHDRDHRA